MGKKKNSIARFCKTSIIWKWHFAQNTSQCQKYAYLMWDVKLVQNSKYLLLIFHLNIYLFCMLQNPKMFCVFSMPDVQCGLLFSICIKCWFFFSQERSYLICSCLPYFHQHILLCHRKRISNILIKVFKHLSNRNAQLNCIFSQEHDCFPWYSKLILYFFRLSHGQHRWIVCHSRV